MVMKKFINVNEQMKNAFDYKDGNPATFSRGIVIDNTKINNTLYISGTASIGSNGETLYKGNFSKQANKTFENLSNVLNESGFTWENVIRMTIYIRDIDRDYAEFNKIRKKFFEKQGIKNYPASTCIEAKLCRSDLLLEIELIAIK